ncbi:MAG TPA: tetratricopeptide repeat protein [Rhodanobacteraceae bacterium]|nr:tetratricopeptide repeat protein [Rhodanobacteraceae bacterium]
MAAIPSANRASPPALRNVVCSIAIGMFAVAGFCASPAHAQTAEQTSSGMQITVPASAGSQASVPASNEDEAQGQLLAQAMQMIKSGQSADAIAGPIAQVIAHYENGPGKDHKKRYYCASSQVEMFLYLGLAAQDHQNAVVLPQAWADAYFEESSALTNLGRIEESRAALVKALALSPMNSLYLSELGYTYEVQHDNEKALDYFQQAEDATNFSPADMKDAELAHALRGEGYALTELHRLDEAEAMYHKALKLDPNDQKSKNELEYIAQLREKLGSGR